MLLLLLPPLMLLICRCCGHLCGGSDPPPTHVCTPLRQCEAIAMDRFYTDTYGVLPMLGRCAKQGGNNPPTSTHPLLQLLTLLILLILILLLLGYSGYSVGYPSYPLFTKRGGGGEKRGTLTSLGTHSDLSAEGGAASVAGCTRGYPCSSPPSKVEGHVDHVLTSMSNYNKSTRY